MTSEEIRNSIEFLYSKYYRRLNTRCQTSYFRMKGIKGWFRRHFLQECWYEDWKTFTDLHWFLSQLKDYGLGTTGSTIPDHMYTEALYLKCVNKIKHYCPECVNNA